MKRIKPLLWFILPAALGWACWIVFFLFLSGAPVSGQDYLRLLIEDPLFFSMLFNTLAPPLLLAVTSAAIALLIRHVIRQKTSPWYYVGLCLVNILIPIAYFTLLNMQQPAYLPITPTGKFAVFLTALSATLSIPSLIIFGEFALFSCFFFWLISRIQARKKQ